MKKWLALLLILCMMASIIPAFAESAEGKTGFGLEDLLGGILNGEGSAEGKTSKLMKVISDLKEQFKGTEEEFSTLVSALTQKVGKQLESGGEKLGTVISGLKDKLAGIGEMDLGGTLNSLLGGLLGSPDAAEESEPAELTPEEEAALAELADRLSQPVEADFPPIRQKAAESAEEFYGEWLEDRLYWGGEELDLSRTDEGLFIGENTYYVTLNGEKASYNIHPETVEMRFEDGTLSILLGEEWSPYVLTEEDELVSSGTGLQIYYKRVAPSRE